MTKSIYDDANLYDHALPPYSFNGREEEEILRSTLGELCGHNVEPRILELGCGSGRMTTVLKEYSSDLTCVDSSMEMLTGLRARHPEVTPACIDARSYIAQSTEKFDVIAAFWSLNYPILSCFEHNDGNSVTALDHAEGLATAHKFIDDILHSLTPGGALLVFFFDSESTEQRIVTNIWERIAPFPGTGRDYTRRVLEQRLAYHEEAGIGELSTVHHRGSAHFRDRHHAKQWYIHGHFKGFERIVEDRNVHNQLDTFLDAQIATDGQLAVGAGLHTILFRSKPDQESS